MSYRSTACSALAAYLLAASPSHAMSPSYVMSTVTTPPNNNAASRFTDPNAQPQRGFSGAMTTVIIGGGGSFGYGGSVTGSNAPGGRILRPEERFRSDLAPSFPNRGPDRSLPDSSPFGFDANDPFAAPRDPYAPGFRAPGFRGNFR